MSEDDTTNNLILFSSDSRHLYRNDVYNILAYPSGFVIQFRYRKKWIPNDIWNSKELKGKNVIVTAVVKHENGEIEFIPLRKGKILNTYKFAEDVLILSFVLLNEWVD